jgi:hypothetical protein
VSAKGGTLTHRIVGAWFAALLLSAVWVVMPAANRAFPARIEVALAACSRETAWADFHPTVTADGAKMSWKARAMSATDTASGGFAAQVLWVGTDSRESDDFWVEAGVTQGWAGQNILTFYTAQGTGGGTVYTEHRWSNALTLGTNYTFAGFYNTTNTYRTTVAGPSGSINAWDWGGHNPNTTDFSAGYESTCGATAKVSKTYVGSNFARRKSDHSYVLATGGSLPGGTAHGNVVWCTNGIYFRYWLNDPNSAGCS